MYRFNQLSEQDPAVRRAQNMIAYAVVGSLALTPAVAMADQATPEEPQITQEADCTFSATEAENLQGEVMTPFGYSFSVGRKTTTFNVSQLPDLSGCEHEASYKAIPQVKPRGADKYRRASKRILEFTNNSSPTRPTTKLNRPIKVGDKYRYKVIARYDETGKVHFTKATQTVAKK